MTGYVFAALIGFAPPDAPPEFVAVSVGDDRPVGRLLKLAPEGTAELAATTSNVVVRDLISLRRVGIALPPFPRGPVLFTTTGDRIPGTLTGGDGRSLHFRPKADPRGWIVPVSSVAVVWFARMPADTPPDPARYAWLDPNRKRDTLLFRNGDQLAGTLEGFTDAPALRFKPDGETRSVPFTEPAALAFNPALARTRRPKGPFAHLVLRDGTRLDITNPASDGETLMGKALFGQDVELPLAELAALDIYQGEAVYVSDLKPRKAEQAGFLGVAWPWAADRNVRGEPLRLVTPDGEATFDKGMGTHPRTVLTYDLGGKYKRFEAVVGLDPAAGGRGTAVARVLVDGKELPLPTLLRLEAGKSVPLWVDTAGAKELALVVEGGPAGDVQADVNWADARLVPDRR